jgi:hypothetical protein
MVEFVVGVHVSAHKGGKDNLELALERLKDFLDSSDCFVQYSYIQNPSNGEILDEQVVVEN